MTSPLEQLQQHLGLHRVASRPAADGAATAVVSQQDVRAALEFLKGGIERPYGMLLDIFGVDERNRSRRQEGHDFTVVYWLMSLHRADDFRLHVPLSGDYPTIATITDLWPNASWYERELWDMMGINVAGHGDLRRIYMPPWWQGHPLRKEHPSRATEMGQFRMDDLSRQAMEEDLEFRPGEVGLAQGRSDSDYMFLNFGPHHPGTHGVLRLVLQMDGDQIVDVVPDIGFHHRGAEKMGERQTWHTYIPYTDRVDYLAGVLNNLPYVLSVEKLAGIEVPDRVKVIRVMLCELFRVINHLVFYGTFVQDLGIMSPVFYMFTDREKAFDIVEAITGARMHPGWFRIGGVAADLPSGWEEMFRRFIAYMRGRLDTYDKMVLRNGVLKARTRGIGQFTTREAQRWGATGPALRATGVAFDLRKLRPYSGYEQFEFEVPTAANGDVWDRLIIRTEEMRQSLRIVEQCVDNMPAGEHKARHRLTTPPIKDRTMRDIETLIDHFLGVTWGPVIPRGEAAVLTEGAKGVYAYYLFSDGSTTSYRTRIRTPSFAHLQMVPYISRGHMIPDLIAILGAVDFVLADVDK
jgi:NADH-quinone oxidoreductase subunit C/D